MTGFPQWSGIFFFLFPKSSCIVCEFQFRQWLSFPEQKIPSKPAALPSLRCFKAVATSSCNMSDSISSFWVLGMVWIMLVSLLWSRHIVQVSIVFFPSILDSFLLCEWFYVIIIHILKRLIENQQYSRGNLWPWCFICANGFLGTKFYWPVTDKRIFVFQEISANLTHI